MVRIKRTSKQMSAKNLAKKNISKKDIGIMADLRNLVIFGAACVLAAGVAFNLYLSSLPPIKNLEDFKPNIVTQFYSKIRIFITIKVMISQDLHVPQCKTSLQDA